MWIFERRLFNFSKIYEIRLKTELLNVKKVLTVAFPQKKINNRISSSITLHEIILITLLFPVSKPPRVVYGGQLISGMFWELIGEIHEITFSPLKRSQWLFTNIISWNFTFAI